MAAGITGVITKILENETGTVYLRVGEETI